MKQLGTLTWGILRFGVWGLGFRVWGLGLGVGGLGWGVLALGFWHPLLGGSEMEVADDGVHRVVISPNFSTREEP